MGKAHSKAHCGQKRGGGPPSRSAPVAADGPVPPAVAAPAPPFGKPSCMPSEAPAAPSSRPKPRDGYFRPSPRVPVPAAPVTRGAHCPLVFCTPVPGTRNLPAPSAKKYPQFTRTLRFCTRNLPAPYLACTRTVPAPVTVPTPVRFCPLSTRRPLLPSHPRSPSPVHTRDPRAPCPRWCPVPVAPAPGRYPQPATVPAPVRFRPRSARRPSLPKRPYPRLCPSPSRGLHSGALAPHTNSMRKNH